jgi:hypothetical protein
MVKVSTFYGKIVRKYLKSNMKKVYLVVYFCLFFSQAHLFSGKSGSFFKDENNSIDYRKVMLTALGVSAISVGGCMVKEAFEYNVFKRRLRSIVLQKNNVFAIKKIISEESSLCALSRYRAYCSKNGTYAFGKKAFSYFFVLFIKRSIEALVEGLLKKERENTITISSEATVVVEDDTKFLELQENLHKLVYRITGVLQKDKAFFSFTSDLMDSYFNHSIEAMIIDIFMEESFLFSYLATVSEQVNG